MNLPTPPSQAQQSPFGSGDDPMMVFSPSHYFEGVGPMGWPLISMPPGQQS